MQVYRTKRLVEFAAIVTFRTAVMPASGGDEGAATNSPDTVCPSFLMITNMGRQPTVWEGKMPAEASM